jgi:hypothetical protein
VPGTAGAARLAAASSSTALAVARAALTSTARNSATTRSPKGVSSVAPATLRPGCVTATGSSNIAFSAARSSQARL